MKYIILILVIIFIQGCETRGNNATGQTVITNQREVCVRNVLYYAIGRGLSVAFNTDSTVKTCDMRSADND